VINHPRTSGWPERTWRNLYGMDVARGIVPGAQPYVVYGERVFGGAASEAVLWETGMPLTLTVPDNVALSVSAASASDYGKQVRLVYLDSDLVSSSVVLTLSSTPQTTPQIRAVETMYSLDGNVVGAVTAATGGTTYALIPAGSTKYDTAVRRIPAGKRLMVHSMYAGSTSGSSAARVNVKLVASFFNGDSFAEEGYLLTYAAVGLQDNTTTLGMSHPLAIPAGEWVGFVASCDKGADITAGIFGWLEDV
jgi:hypothetical protein